MRYVGYPDCVSENSWCCIKCDWLAVGDESPASIVPYANVGRMRK